MERIAALIILLSGIVAPPATAQSTDSASPAMTSRDGKISGQSHDRISRDKLDRQSLCGIGRGHGCSVKVAIARGMFQTGLRPNFSANARCRDIDEHWAIDYTYKRNRESYHGGIDMPAPFGTPMLAAAAGTVVGVYSSGDNSRGIQVILRHTPEDTGIPLWIYTVYGHLQKRPMLAVGDRLRIGDVIGPTGNTGRLGVHKGGGKGKGRGGREASASNNSRDGQRGGNRGGGGMSEGGGQRHQSRRPAIHFAVYFSASPQYASLRDIVIPADGYWMDPIALFRAKPPFDSPSMKALPATAKHVPIPYMLSDHTVHPTASKLIWPYTCSRR